MNKIRTIAKNTSWLLISQILSYLLIFFATIYSAKYLGVENFGILSLSIAFTSIFVVFTDLGLSTLTIREVSRNKSLKSKYLANFILFKIFLAIVMFFFTFVAVSILSYPFQVRLIIYIMTLSVILNSFAGLISSIFQAYEKMEYLSMGAFISNVLIFIGTIIAIELHLNVLIFAVVYLIANLGLFVFYIMIYMLKFSLPSLELDITFWKDNIKLALPFGVTGVFVTIYYWIDSVMLSVMVNSDAVGFYNAAYRLVLVLLVIPSILNTVIFPVMSQFYVTSRESLKMVYEKYFKYMAILGIPLGFGVTLLAKKIVVLIFGVEYMGSVVAFQILVWSTTIIFMSGAFARLLEASNKQMVITKITGICAIVNILLNFVFIPQFSYIGASIITVLTEILSFIFGLKAVSGMGYGFSRVEFIILIKVCISSFIMSMFIIIFYNFNVILLIVGSLLIYFMVLYCLNGWDNEDVKIIDAILNKK
ncbi:MULTISPECIES: flippase [Methanobacterium]|uniref:Flippase n=1 Tax=Methanobacterium veterum TaxID=408577 RepID=A0A9E4ZV25_9EURY|nr:MULTISPECIES: flippase [Methanobacterium]MCZ3364922.1 flippase [Methanobacterium veterum]MCZ3372677.1 flippase [Methanobacterium veterum]